MLDRRLLLVFVVVILAFAGISTRLYYLQSVSDGIRSPIAKGAMISDQLIEWRAGLAQQPIRPLNRRGLEAPSVEGLP